MGLQNKKLAPLWLATCSLYLVSCILYEKKNLSMAKNYYSAVQPYWHCFILPAGEVFISSRKIFQCLCVSL